MAGVWAGLPADARYGLIALSLTSPGRGDIVSTTGTREWADPVVGGRSATIERRPADAAAGELGRARSGAGFPRNVAALGECRCSDRAGFRLCYRVLSVDYANGHGGSCGTSCW